MSIICRMPSFCTLFFAPISIQKVWKEKVEFWNNVHGVRMKSLAPLAITDFFGKPAHDRLIDQDGVLAAPKVIFTLDMNNDDEHCLEENSSDFNFKFDRTDTMHGFGAWFDTAFDEGGLGEQWRVKQSEGVDATTFAGVAPNCVVLSTSPSAAPTHWKQVQFILREPLEVKAGDEIRGKITFTRNRVWRRHFDVVLEFAEGQVDSCSRISGKIFNYTLWRS